MNEFTAISPYELEGNPFQMIDKQWMLVTAGNEQAANTMTASWGGLGFLWYKPVSFVFIRPTRYTYEFTEREEYYSLCLFSEEYRDALKVCGTVSGRDRDKITECNLTLRHDAEAPYFDQAETVIICRKMAAQDIDPACFTDPAVDKCYKNDYHRVYTGEITKVLKRVPRKD